MPPRALFPLFILLAWHVPLRVDSASFYVDSDWTGIRNGTASQPFAVLDSSAWSNINSALAIDDVTIYFSARKAVSDTPSYYHAAGIDGVQLEIDLTLKTTSGSHLLTLDGSSFYNTSESSPFWVSYSGSNMCIVRDFNSQNIAHAKYSNITIHALVIELNSDISREHAKISVSQVANRQSKSKMGGEGFEPPTLSV